MFQIILLESIEKLIMAIDDKIRDDKLQYVINKEAAEISALSYGLLYQLYYISFIVKLINMNILQVKKYYLLIKGK